MARFRTPTHDTVLSWVGHYLGLGIGPAAIRHMALARFGAEAQGTVDTVFEEITSTSALAARLNDLGGGRTVGEELARAGARAGPITVTVEVEVERRPGAPFPVRVEVDLDPDWTQEEIDAAIGDAWAANESVVGAAMVDYTIVSPIVGL